jgi:hypothetical protein
VLNEHERTKFGSIRPTREAIRVVLVLHQQELS